MSELADKERRAIKILRMYRGDDPIEVSYSGGKNSDVILALTKMAEWERERLVEKACWWLRETAHFYVSDFTGELDVNGLLEDFKKSMEE